MLGWPRQARSRDALEQFVRAGEELLAAHEYESAAVGEIARRAGSSVGSFYRLVGDKDRLLRAIHDRFLDDSHARLENELSEPRFAGREPAAIVRVFVATLVDIHARREGLLRALIVRSSADPEFRARVHALNDALETRLATLLSPYRARIGHPRPREAIRFGLRVVLGALNQNTFAHSPESRDTSLLVRELSRVLVSYLALEVE
ncbi:MAG: TetR/AcrR family transcriptional regulator [Myxococcota bacterium]